MNRLLRYSIVVAAVISTSAPTLFAQSTLEKLQSRLGEVLESPPESNSSSNPVAEGPQLGNPETTSSGYLGLVADETSDPGHGVRVLSVEAGGPASSAGVKPMDIITAASGRAVNTMDELARQLQHNSPGSKLALGIQRGSQKLDVTVTLGRQPEPVTPLPDPATSPQAGPTADQRSPEPAPVATPDQQPPVSLGVTVSSITSDLRRRYMIRTDRGVVVTGIRQDSPAQYAKLPIGAVIAEVDRNRIDTPEDLIGLISAAKPGQRIEIGYYHGSQFLRKPVVLFASRPDPLSVAQPPESAGSRRGLPALDRLEQALDRFLPPAVDTRRRYPNAPPLASPAPGSAVPSAESDVAALRHEMELLRAEVQELRRRVADLEQRGRGSPPDPQPGSGTKY